VNRLLMVVSLCVCAMAQAVIPAWNSLGMAKAPLLLAGVLYYALSRDNFQVVESAVLAGILQDSLGPIPLGFSVIAFLSVALLVNTFRDRVFAESAFAQIMLGAAASTLVSLLLFLLLVGGGYRSQVGMGFVLGKSLGMALIGIIAFPLMCRILHGLDLRLGNVRGKGM